MGKYMLLDEDIRGLEEKTQTLKEFVSDEEYGEIIKKLEEIKQLGIDLPDNYDISRVNELINRVVDLQFKKFGDNLMSKAAKTTKREAFLQKLEYVLSHIDNNENTSELLESAERYWDSISSHYDELENRMVREKIDEIKLSVTLKDIQQSGKVDIAQIGDKQNYFLIRNRLLELQESPDISEEDRLLIGSWLGESTDIELGEIDDLGMEKLVKIPKLWGLLAGVKETRMQVVDKSYTSEVTEKDGEESEERKQEIEAVCKKYRIKEEKLRELLEETGDTVYIVQLGPFYRLITATKRDKWIDKHPSKTFEKNDDVRAIIYNNNQKIIKPLKWYACTTAEAIVLPDNLIAIERDAFFRTVNLRNIRLPDGLQTIEPRAFFETGLDSIELPDSLESMGYHAFQGAALKSVKIGRGLSAISEEAFKNCKLESVDIPDNIKRIYPKAFKDNPLTKVTLHEGLKKIDEAAFEGTKLTEITLPSTVKTNPNVSIANSYTRIYQNNLTEESSMERDSDDSSLTLEELKAQKKELEAQLEKLNEQIKAKKQEKARSTANIDR